MEGELIMWSVGLDVLGIIVMILAGNIFFSVVGIVMILVGAVLLGISIKNQPKKKIRKRSKKI